MSGYGQHDSVRTADGREVAFRQWSVADGHPVFCLHGTPGGWLLRHVSGEYERTGLQVITYDRPGYGRSTRLPGRSVADAAGDMARVADALGLGSFGVVGCRAAGRTRWRSRRCSRAGDALRHHRGRRTVRR